jgi:hypothetical protein
VQTNQDKSAPFIDIWRVVENECGNYSLIVKAQELKKSPSYFEAIWDGRKTFDVRPDDREFQEGDMLILREWIPCEKCQGRGCEYDPEDRAVCSACAGLTTTKGYSGRVISSQVTFVLRGPLMGISNSFCVISLRTICRQTKP